MEIKSEDPAEVVVDALIGAGDPLAPLGAPLEVPAVASTAKAAAAAARHANHFLMSASPDRSVTPAGSKTTRNQQNPTPDPR
jgi:hypothetical protein